MNALPKRYSSNERKRFKQVFLPEDIYSKALDSLIVVCADIIPINRKKRLIYLASRKIKPVIGWWFIGGRIFAGEKEVDAASRIFKRETSISILPERFKFFSSHRYFMDVRAQPPQDSPCDMLGFNFTVELKPKEFKKASKNLDPNEYEDGSSLKAFSRDDLVALKVHIPLLDLYDEIFPK